MKRASDIVYREAERLAKAGCGVRKNRLAGCAVLRLWLDGLLSAEPNPSVAPEIRECVLAAEGRADHPGEADFRDRLLSVYLGAVVAMSVERWDVWDLVAHVSREPQDHPRDGWEQLAMVLVAWLPESDYPAVAGILRDLHPQESFPHWGWWCVSIPHRWEGDGESLATACLASRLDGGALDPVRLSVLGDWLEENGCPENGLLAHLRDPGPHHLGCWALDWVRGRGM